MDNHQHSVPKIKIKKGFKKIKCKEMYEEE